MNPTRPSAPAPDRPAVSADRSPAPFRRGSPVVSARLSDDDRARLSDRLDADGVPVAVFVRGLILDALDADGHLDAPT